MKVVMAFCSLGLWLWRRGLLSCGVVGVERLLAKLGVDLTSRGHLLGRERRAEGCGLW